MFSKLFERPQNTSCVIFWHFLIFFPPTKKKSFLFRRYLLQNWAFFGRGYCLWLEHHTPWLQSKYRNSNFTKLFSLGGVWVQSWRIFTLRYYLFGSPCMHRLVSSGESVRLVFKSDRSRNKRGFRIEYKYFYNSIFGIKISIANFTF